jgi:adenosylcobyric acid synthase
VDVDDEDSLAPRLDRADVHKPLDVAVAHLPRLSNFTDFAPLEEHPQIGVRYVEDVGKLGAPDLVILPGTKSTIDDLLWLRQSGLEAAILKLAAAGTPVLGVCGGYQMLGQTISDPEGVEGAPGTQVRGMGLLPAETIFAGEKSRTRKSAAVLAPPFAGAKLEGYEIHMGRTQVHGAPFCRLEDGQEDGCCRDNVWGTYLHGLFDSGELTQALAAFLCQRRGLRPETARPLSHAAYQRQQLDLLADGVRQALDMDAVYRAMEVG